MTDQIPPPPPPHSPAAASTPPPPPEGAPARRGTGGRKLIIGGIVIALVLVGGAAFGAMTVYNKLSGGGTQPHDVMPASTQFYARLDVDPSASQKIELLKLIRKFPDVAKSIGIDSPDQDVRKLIFDELVSGECPDVDYEDDVEPWLGERLGIGGDIAEESFEIAVQVKDEDEARDGIKKLFACSDEDYGIAFLDGYAILSDQQSTVDDAVEAAGRSTLGDSKKFTADFEALGDQGVASAWVDITAVLDLPDVKKALEDSSAADLEQIKKAGSAAVTLRVDDSTLELAGLTGLTDALGTTSAAPIGTLPADTVAALSIGGLGDQIGEQYDTLLKQFTAGFDAGFGTTSPQVDESFLEGMSEEDRATYEQYLEDNPVETPDAQSYIDELEAETGLRLPDDLETLFGDGLTLAVGSENLETIPTLSSPSDLSALDVVLAMTTDPDKGFDLATRLADFASRNGVPLATARTDDGAVLATNQDAADAIGKGGKLGETDTFRSVMPYGDDTTYGLFVNIGTILDKIDEADPPEDVARDLDEAKALSAFGISSGTKDGHSMFSIRLALTK